jgi:WD40 repeat protein
LKDHSETVYSVNFSFDSTYLVSAGRDATVKIWNPLTGENLDSMTIGEEIEYANFFIDNRIVVADNMYGTGTTFLDLTSRKRISPEKLGLTTLAADNTDVVTTVGGLLAAVDYNNRNTIQIWRVTDGDELSSISISQNEISFVRIALSPDGSKLAIGYTTPGGFMQGYNPPEIVVFDILTGAIITTLTGHERSWIVDLTFSPDGQYLASAGDDKHVIVWDIANPVNSVTFTGHKYDIKELAYSPDGRWVVSVSGNHWKPEVSKPGEIKFWDVKTTTGLISLQSSYPAQSVTFSPDGKLLAIGSGRDNRGEILIWEVEDILRMM